MVHIGYAAGCIRKITEPRATWMPPLPALITWLFRVAGPALLRMGQHRLVVVEMAGRMFDAIFTHAIDGGPVLPDQRRRPRAMVRLAV